MAEPPLVFNECGLVWDDEGGQRCELSPASRGEIIGLSRPAQVGEVLTAAELVLTRDELEEIGGLMHETVVSPPAAP